MQINFTHKNCFHENCLIITFSVSLSVYCVINVFLSRTSVWKIFELVTFYFTLQSGSQYDAGAVNIANIMNVMGKKFSQVIIYS